MKNYVILILLFFTIMGCEKNNHENDKLCKEDILGEWVNTINNEDTLIILDSMILRLIDEVSEPPNYPHTYTYEIIEDSIKIKYTGIYNLGAPVFERPFKISLDKNEMVLTIEDFNEYYPKYGGDMFKKYKDIDENSNRLNSLNIDINIFMQDAKQLYLLEILNDSNHFNYNNPELDPGEIEKIFKMIQSVYNSNYPEKDTVFFIYKINKKFLFSLNSISLKVNPSSEEIINLLNGVRPTGNDKLDSLLVTFQFDSVKVEYIYPDYTMITLRTEEEYNLIPIANEFGKIQSILYTNFYHGSWDCDDIILSRTADLDTLCFGYTTSIGTFCGIKKWWVFGVNKNYDVEFIGTDRKYRTDMPENF